MVVSRWLGWILMAAAFAAVAWNGYRFAFGAQPLSGNGADLATWVRLPEAVTRWPAFPSWPSRDIVDELLSAPAAVLFACAGAVLWFIGRKPRRSRPDKPGVKTRPAVGEVPESGLRPGEPELRQALWSSRAAFIGTAAFSLVINVLMLTSAIFMLEIYDRVLPSRSLATLIGLCIIAAILFAALGILDVIRSRLLGRAGRAIDEALAPRVFDTLVRLPLKTRNGGDGLQPLRDLEAVRSFLSGPGPVALFDLPWLPFYLAIVYAFHPLLGVTALLGAIVLVALALVTEVLAGKPIRTATGHAINRYAIAQASLRNAEVLAGMGFASRLAGLWGRSNDRLLSAQQSVSDITGGLGAVARVLRMALQSAVLAVGAYLVIRQEASAGIIIAGSILAARALAPVDTAIANWRVVVAARQSWKRLGQLLALLPARPTPMPLPAPASKFQVESLIVAPPGEQKIVLRDVGFTLASGQALAVIGPSGSGKSSLARILVGAWTPVAGRIRLDGASLDQWAPETLGQHIGYVPQDVELFSGAVGENIARFDANADPLAVIKAAKAADVHDLIVGLAKGYDTEIGDAGAMLSAGQRQRVALARALYGDPFLLVLDEPDASLDQNGEQALLKAIRGARTRGGIVVVMSHRRAVLNAVDLVLALDGGRPLAFGPKELVMQRLVRPSGGAVQALRTLPDSTKTQA